MIRKIITYSFGQYIKLSKYTEKYQNIAKLELDNPKKKNALSVDLLTELD
jgi:enoyl-CoA hydratase/carnithine racemase